MQGAGFRGAFCFRFNFRQTSVKIIRLTHNLTLNTFGLDSGTVNATRLGLVNLIALPLYPLTFLVMIC